MKKLLNWIACITLVLGLSLSLSQAQVLTETSVSLLSKIQKSDGDGNREFTISFGSLNGGLASLGAKDSSADGAAGFASWYFANSRTFLAWSGVTGASIDPENPTYYRNYSANSSVENYAGGPLGSIWSDTLDNRALALITYSGAGGVEEVGLYSFSFDWGNPGQADFPGNIFTLSAGEVTAIFGSADPEVNDGNGLLTTSTVPEPSSGSLLLLGAAGVLALRRLRKTNV